MSEKTPRKDAEIPCAECGGLVVEFSVTNDTWNKVIRFGGREHDKEYLCVQCFANQLELALRAAEARAERLRPVLDEVERAVKKFPTWPTDPLHALAVLGEEFGELTKAIVQTVYEPHKAGPSDVREEAIQTAAMALRFLQSLGTYEFQRGPQHQQPPLDLSTINAAPQVPPAQGIRESNRKCSDTPAGAATSPAMPEEPSHTLECQEQNTIAWECVCDFDGRYIEYVASLRAHAQAATERADRLKAENERLGLGIEAAFNRGLRDGNKLSVQQQEAILALQAENERLREDADRYREIYNRLSIVSDGSGGYEFSIRSIKCPTNVMSGSICGHLDAAIDQARKDAK